jgi:hypothetical protein
MALQMRSNKVGSPRGTAGAEGMACGAGLTRACLEGKSESVDLMLRTVEIEI